MKLRLFIKGPAVKPEGSEFMRATKGPLWCEITFVGDGTRGKVEFLFHGDFHISKAAELAKLEVDLINQLEMERSELRAGKTICDGKSIILTSEKVSLQPWTSSHVATTSRSVGHFIMEWAEPPPRELTTPPPAPDPALEERIAAAKEYQKQLREEYQRTGKPPTDDPFTFYEPVEKRSPQVDAMIARRSRLDKRKRRPEVGGKEELPNSEAEDQNST